jgi:hypothetical protein
LPGCEQDRIIALVNRSRRVSTLPAKKGFPRFAARAPRSEPGRGEQARVRSLPRPSSFPKAFLICDPYHDYATRFIELVHSKFGYRAICLFTDRKRRTYEGRAYPIIHSDAVAGIYDVEPGDLGALARRMSAGYDVVGVIPYNEECVLSAAEIDAALGIGWNKPEVIRRFRDKFALKAHLRLRDPSLRINEAQLVRGVSDVLAHARRFERYVLKPNAGFGNRSIGFFDARSVRADVEAFIARAPATPLILEEYIGGREYFVNGQTDAGGEPELIAIFEYGRVVANGRENLDHRAELVRRDDPVFTLLADYAKRVIRASGLTRSPFHMEVKVDSAGPCLIEVGARLPGLGNAFVCNDVHGGAFDWFDVAAHYYLSASDYGPLPLRWDVYDSLDVRYVSGIAEGDARTGCAGSIAAVEAIGSFRSWAKKPVIGKRPSRTVDVLTIPWSAVLVAPAGADLDSDEARVRELLARPPRRLSLRVAAERAKRTGARLASALRWQVERLLPPLEAANPVEATAAGRIKAFLKDPRLVLTRRRVVRKLQEANIGRRYNGQLEAMTPAGVNAAAVLLAWAREYLGRPHPELGRKGPVCPFIAKTLASNGFLIAVHEEVTSSDAQLRDIVLSHAAEFQRRYPASLGEGATSLRIALPNVPEGSLEMLDLVHEETKTHLMKQKIMVAAIHTRSTRPAIWNPEFPVLRAPIPCFALRHMVVQDIAFLGHNRAAFLTYAEMFGPLFEAGKVSNEFGYVRLYEDARVRFGLASEGARTVSSPPPRESTVALRDDTLAPAAESEPVPETQRASR